jgi:hypothetical protein
VPGAFVTNFIQFLLMALWALRGLPDVAEEFTERLDAAVGLAGRMLLTPLTDR